MPPITPALAEVAEVHPPTLRPVAAEPVPTTPIPDEPTLPPPAASLSQPVALPPAVPVSPLPVRPLQAPPLKPNATATVPVATSSVAPPAMAPMAAPASPSAALAVASPDWKQGVAAWLVAHRVYPDAARRSGAQGVVVLRLTVARDGQVVAVSLVRSAGSDVLDTAAVSMLRGANLPRFNTAMPQDTTTMTVQIHYSLTD